MLDANPSSPLSSVPSDFDGDEPLSPHEEAPRSRGRPKRRLTATKNTFVPSKAQKKITYVEATFSTHSHESEDPLQVRGSASRNTKAAPQERPPAKERLPLTKRPPAKERIAPRTKALPTRTSKCQHAESDVTTMDMTLHEDVAVKIPGADLTGSRRKSDDSSSTGDIIRVDCTRYRDSDDSLNLDTPSEAPVSTLDLVAMREVNHAEDDVDSPYFETDFAKDSVQCIQDLRNGGDSKQDTSLGQHHYEESLAMEIPNSDVEATPATCTTNDNLDTSPHVRKIFVDAEASVAISYAVGEGKHEMLDSKRPSFDPSSGTSAAKKDTEKMKGLPADTAIEADGAGVQELESGSLSPLPVVKNAVTEIVDESISQSRRCKVPTRFMDETAGSLSSTPSRLKNTSRKAPLRGNFTSSYLLQNPKSKLATANLMEVLTEPRAWSILSVAEKDHLIAMLPCHLKSANSHPDQALAPKNPMPLLRHNQSFQTALRLFQEDLSAGRYDPTWLKNAAAASAKRAAGDFDEWKEQNREKFWGQKQKVDWRALAGDSGQHGLVDVVRGGVIELGDVWVLCRALGRAKGAVVVEKEAKVLAKSDDGLLTFSFPPGQHKLSAPALRQDIELAGIHNPRQLSEAMLMEDGRINTRSANAWKEFRCARKNQDMGSLWDVRELYHARLTSKKE